MGTISQSRAVEKGLQPGGAEWVRRITGSKIAAIFGDHPYLSAERVQQEAIHGPADDEPSRVMLRGRYLEPIAVQLFEDDTGRVTRRVGPRVWQEDETFLATVDRQILSDDEHDTSALEVKIPGWTNFSKIKRHGLPPYMIYQGQLEALVWGYPEVMFHVLHADSFRTLTFPVQADPEFQQEMVERARDWWDRHVIRGEPVEDADPPEDVPEVEGEVIERVDEPFRACARRILEARDLRQEAAELEKEAKREMKALLGAFGTYEGGGARIHYRQTQPRTSWKRSFEAVARVRPPDPAKLQFELEAEFGARAESWLEQHADDLALDFDEFVVKGSPSERLTPYRIERDADHMI